MKISVIVKTNTKTERIEQTGELEYKIYTRALAVEGRANKRIVELLSQRFSVPKSSVQIIKGLFSNRKLIEIVE